MKTGCDTYQKINTMSMSQLELILAVYRGTIGYLEQAKKLFTENDYSAGRTACDRARKCMVHLYTTLDMEKGGEIARYLGGLYAYAIEQLDLAVASKANGRLDDIIGVFVNLKDGWEQLRDDQKLHPGSGIDEIPDNHDKNPDSIDSAESRPDRTRITISA